MILSQVELLDLEHKVSKLLKTSGRLLEKEWQNIQKVSLKDLREPVTEFDVRMENTIRLELSKILPEAGFIVEEGDNDETEEYNWIIDPIDQTKNFIGRIPLFYTQAALLYKREPVVGIIYNPVSGQLFSASSGNGIRLNNTPLVFNIKNKLEEAVIDIDFGGTSQSSDWRIAVLKGLMEAAYRVRVTGGAFAAYMVTGGIDAYVGINDKTKIVDQMPRIVLAREAGLKFETLTLRGHRVFIAGTSNVFEQIKENIEKSIL